MKNFLPGVISLLLLLSGISYAADLLVVTENFEPYNYQDGRRIIGISSDVVKETLKRADLTYELKIFPWSRAYKMALNKKDVLIYSIGRNNEREGLFHWIGPIAPPVRSGLFKLKDREEIQILTLEDAKRYKTGLMTDGWEYQYFIKQGFQKEVHLEPITDYTIDIKKLFFMRTDLIAMSEWLLKKRIQEMGFSYDQVERVLVLREVDMYMALSKNTSDKIVNKVQSAFESLKQDGFLLKAEQKYK